MQSKSNISIEKRAVRTIFRLGLRENLANQISYTKLLIYPDFMFVVLIFVKKNLCILNSDKIINYFSLMMSRIKIP